MISILSGFFCKMSYEKLRYVLLFDRTSHAEKTSEVKILPPPRSVFVSWHAKSCIRSVQNSRVFFIANTGHPTLIGEPRKRSNKRNISWSFATRRFAILSVSNTARNGPYYGPIAWTHGIENRHRIRFATPPIAPIWYIANATLRSPESESPFDVRYPDR